jgi:hypothetical protein
VRLGSPSPVNVLVELINNHLNILHRRVEALMQQLKPALSKARNEPMFLAYSRKMLAYAVGVISTCVFYKYVAT